MMMDDDDGFEDGFGPENISVENAIFVIAFSIIFERSEGAIAPASQMAARCLDDDGG